MTIDPEISKYVEVGYLSGISKIKNGTPEKIVKEIDVINEMYKQRYGEYIWNFKKG